MQLILKKGIEQSKIDNLCEEINQIGCLNYFIEDGASQKIILPNVSEKELQQIANSDLIERTEAINTAYQLASRKVKQSDTVIDFGDFSVGNKEIAVIAGPCAVESLEQCLSVAKELSQLGVKIFRAGAYKPRTSPYAFQGLGEEGLEILAEVKRQSGMKIITEVINAESLPKVEKVADILQIGSRNMQNFDLLKAVGKTQKPILLKRGMSASIQDFLMSAEYILAQGNSKVILCERGIRTFETATRNTLDLNAVPLLKSLTHLPVFVDPSHGTGIRELVAPMAYAGIAAGAHGLTMEVHPNPDEALSDGMQSLTPIQFKTIYHKIKEIESVFM